MTQKKSNRIVLMALMVALVSLMISPVLGANDPAYWDDHYMVYSTANHASVVEGTPPWGVVPIYTDSDVYSVTQGDVCHLYDPTSSVLSGSQKAYYFFSDTDIGNGYFWYYDYVPEATDTIHFTPGGVVKKGDVETTTFQLTNHGQAVTMGTYCSNGINWVVGGPTYVYYTNPSPPIADFTYTPDQPWIAPLEVTFTDASTGPLADTITWELESIAGPYVYGYAQAMDEVTFRFDYAGTYQVNLTITNGSVSNSKTETFTVYNPAGTYSLSIDPSEINVGQNTTALISSPTGDFSIMDNYVLYCSLKDSMVSGVEIKSDGNEPMYHFDGAIWQQVNDITHAFDVPYGADFPESITLSGWDSPGEYECEATLFTIDNTPVPRMYADVTVTGEAGQYQTVVVNVRDSSDASYIYGATASIKRADGTWVNKTVTSGPVSFQVTDMEWIGFTATASGYEDTGVLYTQITQGKNIDIVLSKPLPAADPGFATLQIYAKTSSGGAWVALQGVSMVLSDGQTKITPESGLATFTMTANSSYTATASKPGYNSLTIPITCGASTCGGYTMVLTSTSTNPTVTTTGTAEPGTETTYPPGVPMPGTTITYPPGVPVAGTGTTGGNATARDAAQMGLDNWMIYGVSIIGFVLVLMLIGMSGDALKKWSWLWK